MSGDGNSLRIAIIIGIARGITILIHTRMISNSIIIIIIEFTSVLNIGILTNLLVMIYGGSYYFIP